MVKQFRLILNGMIQALLPLQQSITKQDTLTQSQKKAPDHAEFEKAQIPKIEGLIEQDVFEYVPISQVHPRIDF
jgi:hypothetical protein